MTHIIDGQFQSDRHPTAPRDTVPLDVKEPRDQDLIWEYAERARVDDAGFADELQALLKSHGLSPPGGSKIKDARATGYIRGRQVGEATGRNAGYSAGKEAGFSEGHAAGRSEGYDAGLEEGVKAGYDQGYAEGNAPKAAALKPNWAKRLMASFRRRG